MKSPPNSCCLPSFQSVSKRQKVEPRLKKVLTRISQSILKFLGGNSDPKIWITQKKDQTLIWHIYDPQTQQSAEFLSEEEVRIWLEKRYYH